MSPPAAPSLLRALILLVISLASVSAAAQIDIDFHDVRIRSGDDPTWAHPELDESDWRRGSIYALPDTSHRLWLRIDVATDSVEALGIDVSGVVAREVFWDGVLVGRSGRVGVDRASEQVGLIDTVFPIPDSLAQPGAHVVAIRMSTFHRPPTIRGYLLNFRVGDLRELTASPLLSIGIPLVFLGGFVLVALYYGVLYAADRRTPYLLTSLLCLAVAALLVTESWRTLLNYPFDLHVTRLRLVAMWTCAVGWLLSAVFVVQFRVPRGRWILAGVAAAIGAVVRFGPWSYDTEALAVFAVSLAAALALTLWAVAHGRPGARLAAAGVVVCLAALLATDLRFLDVAFFPSFSVLIAGLLASLGMQTRDARRRHQASLARAARLEAELLRKHLQPHFLMNTLTSVMEWVETDPAVGARALGALADELRTLSELSGERLVPTARELALCRAHLDVMGFRRDVAFTLDADGVDPDAMIPPAVLHTLVENAVTHNAYRGAVTFRLRETREAGRRRLTLRTPLVDAAAAPGPERGGLGYVRARLDESLPGAWALASGADGDAWVTHLDLPLAAPRPFSVQP